MEQLKKDYASDDKIDLGNEEDYIIVDHSNDEEHVLDDDIEDPVFNGAEKEVHDDVMSENELE